MSKIIQRTTIVEPKDKKVFDTYSNVAAAAVPIGILAQCISAITQTPALVEIIKQQASFLPVFLTWTLSIIVSILVIENGIRRFLTSSIKAIQYKNIKGNLLLFSCSGISILILITGSLMLSQQGAKDMFDDSKKEYKIVQIDQSKIDKVESLHDQTIAAKQAAKEAETIRVQAEN